MTRTVYLVCGVPGSGKTWVCRQMDGTFHYLPHDLHYKNHGDVVVRTARISEKPIITECPFGERVLREQLEKAGLRVIPFFVVEKPDTVKKRYEEREKKHVPQNVLTRAARIGERADEWKAPKGTSTEILQLLQALR